LTNDNLANDDINEEDCDVEITDLGDFLGNLKEGVFQYVDMEEVNRRNNTSRFRTGSNKSNMNFSTSTIKRSSRFGGVTSSRLNELRTGGSILMTKNEGKASKRKFDLRERLKNLDSKINK
jgi:hypothetical protein